MEQEITGNAFGWWCISYDGKIWLPNDELPYGFASQWQLTGLKALHIGEWEGVPVFFVRQNRADSMVTVRRLLEQGSGLFQLAGRAVQLEDFYRSHKYCGYCGSLMRQSQREWACLCDHCRERYYPQIAPCVIVAIRRGEEILLAQHQRHKNGIYTVLAGFVEVGETLEQAVSREVMEESRVNIRNIRYIASQPWPFPHSLMMAYMADYDSGELQHDPEELLDAQWFHFEKLPALLPPPGTVARRLIEDTVALCRQEQQR